MYGQIWCKTGAQSGLELTVGKFVPPIGYESIDATSNPLFSRSYLFNYSGPNTTTGGMIKYIFSPQLSLYVAPVEGWDVFKDNNHMWTIIAGGTLSGKEQVEGQARTSFSFNISTGPEQPHNTSNYTTLVDVILTHRWTPQLCQVLNADYGVEEGAVGSHAAQWAGIAHYLTYTFNEYVSSTWRFEWFRDPQGAQTGTAGSFFESTLGVSLTPMPQHSLLKNLMVRPEFRWDFSEARAFGGGRRNQLTAAFDVIFKF